MIEGWFFKHISQSQCTNKISNTIYPSAFDNTDIAKALSIMVKNFKSLSKNNKKDRIKKKYITQHLKEQCAVFWVNEHKTEICSVASLDYGPLPKLLSSTLKDLRVELPNFWWQIKTPHIACSIKYIRWSISASYKFKSYNFRGQHKENVRVR